MKFKNAITVWLTIILLGSLNQLLAQNITPGTIWLDTQGKPINAHGGGMLYQKGKYYWYGEFKGMGPNGNKAMDGVSCYTSKDLLHWKNEGLVLKVIADTNSRLQPGCLIERPKVIYNAKTGKYVMWFHHELKDQGYKAAMTGLAIADNPTDLSNTSKVCARIKTYGLQICLSNLGWCPTYFRQTFASFLTGKNG